MIKEWKRSLIKQNKELKESIKENQWFLEVNKDKPLNK